ncbi:MAG: hypothetical protein LBH00_06545 [Planctomycetaceae bacterium]|jgi:hypothetical protein|nr:hypothetical protein [Planctomycetaceae bacterium]
MKTVITEENFWANHFYIEAIYKGFHVRVTRKGDQLTVLSEHTPDEYEMLSNRLVFGSFPMPFLFDEIVANLVKVIELDPNSKIIEKNEFDMQYYPPGIHGA